MKTQPSYADVDVLLIEDNPQDVEMTLRALEKRNLANKVFCVRDGQEALDFFFGEGAYAGRDVRGRPHVVLLDLKLPKIDGHEVLRRIREDERTRTIPVVVLTSSPEERDLARSYLLGVNSYVVKPLDFDQFSEAVSEVGLYWLLVNRPPPTGGTAHADS